ncbi:MAG: DUF4038 domain-containing protein, partial [Armatimonadia bacterium]|nr:DUF4038 domain-containing protein [Armatimonadia bacterium]
PSDSGLHGRIGEVQVSPYDGPSPLYRHGRLRVAPNRRTLEHADGTPFLWVGDTWWMGLLPRLDWPHGFQELAFDRVAKGFNVVQIVAGPQPDYDAIESPFDPLQGNEGGLPWERDWERINPAYFDLADLRLSALVEWGLMPCVVGMWGYFLPAMGEQNARRHWRYLLARYGAYPVVWCVAGETDMVTYSLRHGEQDEPTQAEIRRHQAMQREGWTGVASYVREVDPFGNLITTHPSRPDSRSMLLDESALDLNMLQTGHAGYNSLEQSVVLLSESLDKTPSMPTFISEACYEGIMGGSGAEIQRFLFWASITLGACGFTYGAQGIWAMNSPEQPYTGYTGSWGDGFWQDAMHYPGSAQVGLGQRLLQRWPWWLLQPCVTPAADGLDRPAFCCRIPGALMLIYSPPNWFEESLSGLRADWSGSLLDIAIEPGARYRACYMNPRTGEEVRSYVTQRGRRVELGAVLPREDGFWTPPRKPTMEDWVLVLEDRKALDELAASSPARPPRSDPST